MDNKIDYDRGVIIRTEPKTGVDVYMYRDSPGVWLNAYGTPVTEELAKMAGFDVERYSKERIKRERMATAMAAIEQEMASAAVKKAVVMERGGFSVIDIGLGRFHVEDPDGNQLTSTFLPKETAIMLLDQLSPPVVEPKKVEEVAEATEGDGVVTLPKITKVASKAKK